MTALQRSLLSNRTEHRLIPYNKERKRQIECKYCKWIKGETHYTTWKCSACVVFDTPFGFCKRRRDHGSCHKLWHRHLGILV